MNKIHARIAELTARIDALPTQGRIALSKTLTLDLDEYVKFQNLQAGAHASGRLSVDEAQTIYLALKNWLADERDTGAATIAARFVVTQLMGELLRDSIENFRANRLPAIKRERARRSARVTTS
jgi:hypothetical protein